MWLTEHFWVKNSKNDYKDVVSMYVLADRQTDKLTDQK